MSSSTPRAATLGPPPTRVVRAVPLGAPPTPHETKNNLKKGEMAQLNVRVDPDIQEDIKIAAIREKMSLGSYVAFIHERYQREKQKGA